MNKLNEKLSEVEEPHPTIIQRAYGKLVALGAAAGAFVAITGAMAYGANMAVMAQRPAIESIVRDVQKPLEEEVSRKQDKADFQSWQSKHEAEESEMKSDIKEIKSDVKDLRDKFLDFLTQWRRGR